MKFRQLRWTIAICCLILSSVKAADSEHVKASLIADVSALRAGRPFALGVLLEIDPGWHIYWTNPGDSGAATMVRFNLPEGFVATPDPFPVPRKIHQPGNEVVYGYEGTVLLSARVMVPETAHIGDEIDLSAAVAWLCCKDVCIPEKEAPVLRMKVSDHGGPANVKEFARYQTTVTPLSGRSPDVERLSATIDRATHVVTVAIHWKAAVSGVEMFPGTDDAVALTNVVVKSAKIEEKGTTTITLKAEILPGQQPAGNRLAVLIAYRDAQGQWRGFETTIPVK